MRELEKTCRTTQFKLNIPFDDKWRGILAA
jgi:hypothetical protein